MTIQSLQLIKDRLPYLVISGQDESLSSWLIRLSRRHYCNTKNFCAFYGLESLLKSSIDVEGNLLLIQNNLNIQIGLPSVLKDKVPHFKWDRGRSKWLIEPNRKGHSGLNSFSKFCPKCLKEKGYYQLKWKLNLFVGCIECGCYLIDCCSKCGRTSSPLKADLRFTVESGINPIFHCWHCAFDLRKSKSIKMNPQDVDQLVKIDRSYNEDPTNIRYLTFLQFGIILVNGNYTL